MYILAFKTQNNYSYFTDFSCYIIAQIVYHDMSLDITKAQVM